MTPPVPSQTRLGEDFRSAAARLAGLAGVVFGWTPDVFWRATPAELAALVRAVVGDARAADGAVRAALREKYPDG